MREELPKHVNTSTLLAYNPQHIDISSIIATPDTNSVHRPSIEITGNRKKIISRGSILLVDDDDNTRRSLKLIFDNQGYSIDTVATAHEALEAVKSTSYDLAIVDIRLPDMEGTSLITPFKEINPEIEVLVVTAYASTNTAIKALNQGAVAYITKPLNLDDTLIKVNDVIEKKHLIKENNQLHELARLEIKYLEQKEKELQESKKKFEELAELLPQTIYECDMEGRITYTNRDSYRMWGYTKNDFNRGLNILELIAPESRDIAAYNINSVLSGEKTNGMEYMALRKNGTRFPIIVFSSPIIHESEITGIRGILIDVTRQKHMEESARHAAEQLQNLMETAPVIICRLDADGYFQQVNNEFIKITGYPRKQVIKTHCTELGLLSQKDIQSLSVKSNYLTSDPQEIEICHKDGTPVWLMVRAKVIEDNGNAIGFQIIAHDITARKKAEEKLKESNERYQLLFNNINDAVMVFNLNPDKTPGKYIEVNEAACIMHQYSKEELLQMTPNDILKHKITREITETESLEKMLQQRNATPEKTVITKNGTELTVDARSHFFYYQGRPAVITVTRDIEHRKKAEEALQKSYHAVKQAMDGTIKTIASLVELRDPYTAGHQARVSTLACAIAEEMGYSEEELNGIHAAGLVHDIGKISIPAEILSKPGLLNEMEFSMIKTHPVVGYEILKQIEFPWPISRVVLQHHERLDGSGYPDGISGNDICMEARIISVADIVEAMATHRPYRPALGVHKALEEISMNKGILYDPQVVDTCLYLFNKKGFQFQQE